MLGIQKWSIDLNGSDIKSFFRDRKNLNKSVKYFTPLDNDSWVFHK